MVRPPASGAPAFRFKATEVAEMESVLQAHNNALPAKVVLKALAEKFSETPDRMGNIVVQTKQVLNWFQNRRHAKRGKANKPAIDLNIPQPAIDLNIPLMQMDDRTPVTVVPQTIAAPSSAPVPAPSVPIAGRNVAEHFATEFEAKSRKDGAWYDVSAFLSRRNSENGDPEVLVRYAGSIPDMDEWVNTKEHVRPRSIPCESSECIAVHSGDLILCFQEGKKHALYFDAHVLDIQRRRHDIRGCRCRFLVCFDHDQSEEVVALRKICRRPETEYRLQQLHGENEEASENQQETCTDPSRCISHEIIDSPADIIQKQHTVAINMAASGSRIDVPEVVKTMTPKPKIMGSSTSVTGAVNW